MTDVLDPVTHGVSVVICTHAYRWAYLVEAVASLRSQTLPPHEVIVVVDHCPALLTQASRELLGVVVIDNTAQRGLSGARNVGFRAATGDIVAFVDDDATTAPDWLERLAGAYDDDLISEPRARVVHRVPRTGATGEQGGVPRATTPIAGVDATQLRYAPASLTVLRQRVLAMVHNGAWARASVIAEVGMLAVVIRVWWMSLSRGVRLNGMTDFGLVSVLPATFWLALGLLTVSFCWQVRRRQTSVWLLAAHVVVFVLMIHATPTLLYGTLRYSWAWKHVGIVDYILGHGGVNLHLTSLGFSAYQEWPGFFSLNALLTSGSGFNSALSYASWAPPVTELLLLGPLLLIFRTFTSDRRLCWTAVWLFYLGNWVGQDYFSPQAFTYFLYLTVVAVCVRYFMVQRALAPEGGDTQTDVSPTTGLRSPLSRGQSRGLYAAVVTIMIAIASSHQLTPIMLISALALLALARRLRYRSLPVVLAILTIFWIVVVANTFLHENLRTLVENIGHPLGNTSSTFINLHSVGHDLALTAQIDRLLTGGLVVLAVIGYWRGRHMPRSRAWRPVLLLGVAPVVALFLNNYGTEIDFRVFLFALPFIALYAASAFVHGARGRFRRFGDLARLATAVVLLGGFAYAYYGKERMNYFPPGEEAVMKRLYSTAPAGSRLMAATGNMPWAFVNYSSFEYEWFAIDDAATTRAVDANPVAQLADMMSVNPNTYLVFSSSDDAAAEMSGALAPGTMARIEWLVKGSPQFRVLYSNPSISVLQLTTSPLPVPPGRAGA